MKTIAQAVAILSGLAVILAFAGVRSAEKQAPTPILVAPAKPADLHARKKLLPWREVLESVAPDGTEPTVDFPPEMWFRNTNSRRGGDGMCVFTSWEFSATQAGLSEFKGFRDWCSERYPGGGWPAKLAQLVKAYCEAKKIDKKRFDPQHHLQQYEGADFGWIERCLRNGWMPAVSLFHSPRYDASIIYHMTNCPHLDSKWGCIQDNNFKDYEWSPRKEFERRVTNNGRFWAFTAIAPGPPPPPRN